MSVQHKYISEDIERDDILNSPKWDGNNVKVIFPNVEDSDVMEITRLMNEKIKELKMKLMVFDPSTLERMTPKEFFDAIRDYTQQLTVEYDKYGLKKKYDKITKVLDILPDTTEYKDHLEIVQEIKKEYIKTKNLNKSSMLYLNKIYRQLTQEKDDEENKQQEFEKITKAEFANLRKSLGSLTD